MFRLIYYSIHLFNPSFFLETFEESYHNLKKNAQTHDLDLRILLLDSLLILVQILRKSQGIFFLKHRCKSINYTISLKAPLNYLILPHVGMILNSSLMLCQLSRRQNLYWRFVPLLHLYNCLRYKLEIRISSFLSF